MELYELHTVREARPPSGSHKRELVCPTCTLTIPCTVLSTAETRRRRRIQGVLALTGVFTLVGLVWLAVLSFKADSMTGIFWAFGALGAVCATAWLIDLWWQEDGIWLRDHTSGVRRPYLGPHALRYR